METIVEENEPRTPQTNPKGDKRDASKERTTHRAQSAVQKPKREDTKATLKSTRSEMSRQDSRLSRATTFFEGGLDDGSEVSEAESVQSLSSQLREYADQRARDKPRQNLFVGKDGKKNELLLESIHDVMGEMDLATLQIKIARAARALVDAKRVSLYLTNQKKRNYLETFVFHATEKDLSEKVEDFLEKHKAFSLSFKMGIAGHVARTLRSVNMGSAREHSSFNIDVDQTGQSTTGSVLCMAISDTDSNLVGVIELMNKTSKPKFGQEDEDVMKKYLKYAAKALLHTRLFQTAVNEYGMKNGLYKLSQDLVKCQGDVERAVHVFLLGMKNFIPCERYYLFVLQRTREGRRRDRGGGHDVAIGEVYCGKGEQGFGIRKYKNHDFVSWRAVEIVKYIAVEKGMLALTEENLASATGEESLTDKEGFICKTLLCIPVFDAEETVHSVIQLANRIGGPNFSDRDMRVANDVIDTGGFALRKEEKDVPKSDALLRGQYVLEKLAFHKSGDREQVSKALNSKLLRPQEIGLYDFDFDASNLTDENLLMSVLTMFNERELTKKLGIPHDTLSRFAISVMMSYRPLPYHNWRHAVCATQSMFSLIYTAGFDSYFDYQEILVLLCACLCHDIDHRGMIDVPDGPDIFFKAPLSLVYNSSTKIHQHASKALLLICSKDNNVFQSLSFERYRGAISLLQYAINATDMSGCFASVTKMQNLLSSGKLSKKDYHTKQTIISLLMIACDQNAMPKSWMTHRKVTQLAINELTENGGIGTLRLMDIERDFARMQFQYLDVVGTPLFAVLSALSGKMAAVEQRLNLNKMKWKEKATQDGLIDMSTDEISLHFSESSRSNSQKSNVSRRSSEQKSMSISSLSSGSHGYSSKLGSKRSSSQSSSHSKPKRPGPNKQTLSSSPSQTSEACVII